MSFKWTTKKDPERYSQHKMKQYHRMGLHIVFQCGRSDRTRTSFSVPEWKLYNEEYQMRWDRFVAMNELLKEHYPGVFIFVLRDKEGRFWKWSLRDKRIPYPGDDFSIEDFETLLIMDKL